MAPLIEAALIGDSHCRAIEAAANEMGISFRQTVTAASPMFQHCKLITNDEGQISFEPAASHFDETTQDAKSIQNKRSKTRKLTQGFRKLIANPLPICINVGTGPHAFVSRILAAQDAAGGADPFISHQLARRAAAEYFAEYREFYRVLVAHCSDITCFHAPTRFTPRSRSLWLAYDAQVASEMSNLGIEMLDIRADVGCDDLSLRPEFHVANSDDQVHANPKWGAEVIAAFRTKYSQKNGT